MAPEDASQGASAATFPDFSSAISVQTLHAGPAGDYASSNCATPLDRAGNVSPADNRNSPRIEVGIPKPAVIAKQMPHADIESSRCDQGEKTTQAGKSI